MHEYVDAEHIVTMAEEGKVELLDASVSAEANQHLKAKFPLRSWSTIVAWDRIPSSSLAWVKATNDETVEWVMTTSAANSDFGLLLFSPNQRCVIAPLEFMARHLDELVGHAPGCRVVFAVDRDANGKVVFGRGVIEFNGKGELFATTED